MIGLLRKLKIGEEPDASCNRDGCTGVIEEVSKVGSCTCHAGHPPCQYCTSEHLVCNDCGWEEYNSF